MPALKMVQDCMNENYNCATGQIPEELQSSHKIKLPLEDIIKFPHNNEIWDNKASIPNTLKPVR